MDRVLIFGISGFVGKYLADEFIDYDYEVYGSDMVRPENLRKEVTFLCGDLLNSKKLQKMVFDIEPDIIINLAAISSVGASWNIPQTTVSVNVVGALNILEASRQCQKHPKVLFVGSSEEYDECDKPIDEEVSLNANNPYGISKVAQERFAYIYRQRYGMKVYCVRPFNHTGVGQKETFVLPSFCRQVAEIEKSGQPGTIKVGNLSAKRDFSSVKDIVRAYRMILEHDDCEAIYNVGSGKAYGIDEILDYIISLSTQEIKIEVDSERFRPVDTPVICCNHNKITEELGWIPQYSIFDTVKEMYEYYLHS